MYSPISLNHEPSPAVDNPAMWRSAFLLMLFGFIFWVPTYPLLVLLDFTYANTLDLGMGIMFESDVKGINLITGFCITMR